MQIALMIEGQDGLNWSRWQGLARVAEDSGFAGLFRSDHFNNPHPPDKDSLELWVSLTWLASHSERLSFGPIVSPISFRDPAITARQAAAVHDLSRGRLRLGLGAGWQTREHHTFGYDLLDMEARFKRFEEGLEVIVRLLREPGPVTFEGHYYQLRDAVALPHPVQPVPILIGGNGEKRTLPLVARFANEWNGVMVPPARYAELNSLLDGLLVSAGRAPASVRRSLMQSVVCGRTPAAVEASLAGRSRTELRAKGALVGTPEEIRDGLDAYRQAGVQCIMLQWLDMDDLEGLKALAEAVVAHA